MQRSPWNDAFIYMTLECAGGVTIHEATEAGYQLSRHTGLEVRFVHNTRTFEVKRPTAVQIDGPAFPEEEKC